MEVKLSIPTTLNEITLGQYQEFSKLDITKESEVQSKMIEIFCKVPVEVVRSMKAKDITDICIIINNMFDVEHQMLNRFKLNNKDYGFIPDLENMSFGEYVDLDTFMGDNDNLHRAMNVLYRPIELLQGQRYTLKEYDPDINEDAKNYPLDACFFEQTERGEFSAISGFTTKWGWYNSIYAIANGDITRFENITKLNVHECLTYLTYTKEKNEIEARNIKSKFK
jgi:hypothetical protein